MWVWSLDWENPLGKKNGNQLEYSRWEDPMDRGAWKATVHGVAQNWTRLSEFTFTFHFHGLEKEMATHSHVLAWRIPGTGEPGRLPSMGSHRVGHDWCDLAAGLLKRSLASINCIHAKLKWDIWFSVLKLQLQLRWFIYAFERSYHFPLLWKTAL